MTIKGRTINANVRTLLMIGALGGLMLLSLQVTGCAEIAPQQARTAEAATTAQSSTLTDSKNISGQTTVVQVVEAKEGKISSALSYTGDVKPKAQVSLSAKAVGRIEELNVEVGSVVRAGDVIGRLDRAGLEAQLRQADAALAMANSKVAQMETGPREEMVSQAEANLRASEAKLAQVKAGATAQQIEQAEIAIRAARNQLYTVQSQADAYIGNGHTIFTKEMKEAQSGAAYEQVRLAEARLAELKAGATPDQINQVQAAVDAARSQLDLAKNPYTENDLQFARASVSQAKANVDLVKSQLAEANIVAPVDGVVSDKFLSVGALVAPQVPIVSIISSDLEVAISIEEARAGEISVGQPASLNVAAYPDRTFNGAISSVAPTVDPKSRTFTVKVSTSDEEGKLKAGMFAKVNIGLEERQGLLLVPERAVIKRGTETNVFVVTDGKARVRRVELGASDSQNVEVKSGLVAGDKVVVDNSSLKDGEAVAVEAR